MALESFDVLREAKLIRLVAVHLDHQARILKWSRDRMLNYALVKVLNLETSVPVNSPVWVQLDKEASK